MATTRARHSAAGAQFLDPAVLGRISNLELLARTVVDGFLTGLHRSPYLGFSMDFAYDGLSGLHLATTNMYDAIILDIALPGIDGFEICKRLRDDAHIATPILMLNARGLKAHVSDWRAIYLFWVFGKQ